MLGSTGIANYFTVTVCFLQDVDWESNAATAIFVHDDSSFSVARKGLMLTEYGKVDRAKAKSRALHGEQAVPCNGWSSPKEAQIEPCSYTGWAWWRCLESQESWHFLYLASIRCGSSFHHICLPVVATCQPLCARNDRKWHVFTACSHR